MSIFSAKYLFLLVVTIVIAALSALFSQLYSDQLPLSIIAICCYIFIVIAIVSALFYFINKSISVPEAIQSQTVSTEELFSYTHDQATNLPTAPQALKVFEAAMKSSAGKKFGVIVFKPYNFQHVNTLLGYHNSDLLLLQLAYCLQKKLVKNTELLSFGLNPQPVRIARLQSLQFLAIYDLTNNRFDDHTVINETCKQLASSVPEAMSFKSFSQNFELNFGIAISGLNGNTFDELIAHAGDALLSGIEQKQQINYFENSQTLHNKTFLARMETFRQDVEEQKLFCYLKPQINTKNYHIDGFQLKIHWYEDSIDKPAELPDFVELADHSGELYNVTKFMLDEALATLAILHGIGVYQRISVMLSSESLFEVDLVDYIEKQLAKYEIQGKYLMIELTESVMLSASDKVKHIIDQLKSLEIQISIDNFSGSFESLRYVRKTAIHQLKINCDTLSNDIAHRVDKAITNSLVTLTRSMKIPLVATNINRHEASEAYIAMGGELMQGDIIHPGVVPDEIEIWLENWYLQHPDSIPPEAKPSIY